LLILSKIDASLIYDKILVLYAIRIFIYIFVTNATKKLQTMIRWFIFWPLNNRRL